MTSDKQSRDGFFFVLRKRWQCVMSECIFCHFLFNNSSILPSICFFSVVNEKKNHVNHWNFECFSTAFFNLVGNGILLSRKHIYINNEKIEIFYLGKKIQSQIIPSDHLPLHFLQSPNKKVAKCTKFNKKVHLQLAKKHTCEHAFFSFGLAVAVISCIYGSLTLCIILF